MDYLCLLKEKLRGPISISVDITNKCNFKCLHCYNNSGRETENELDDSEIIDLVQQIAEFNPKIVCLCGGEPLLRFNLLLKCINILFHSGSQVSMVTNGYLLDEDRVLQLKKAGINTVQVSLDGASNETYQKLRLIPDGFHKAVNAIRYLKKHEIYTAIAICPTKYNYEEIDTLLRLGLHLGVDLIRTQPLMLLGRAKQYLKEQQLTDEEYAILLRRIKAFSLKKEVEWGDPTEHIAALSYEKESFFSHMHLRANGDLVLSAYLNIVVGNIRKHLLKEYWDSGYASVWNIPEIKQVTKKITGIKTLEYYNEKINIKFDLVEESNNLNQ